jgi:acetyl esterase/lipase
MMGTVVTACLALIVLAITLVAQQSASGEAVMRPVIPEEVAPVEAIAPVAEDGFVGEAYLRKPRGAGPFPAVLLIHGGLARRPSEVIKAYALRTHSSRFLEAGYVILAIRYRGRDTDAQSPVSLRDSVAAVEYLKELAYVDADSVVVNGCSGGGDLALEVAAATEVAAIAPEEPAARIMAGVRTAEEVARGRGGSEGIDYVQRYRSGDKQRFLAKIARISSPILLIQGDRPNSGNNQFNAEIVVPALRAADKSVEVMTYEGQPHCFSFYNDGPDLIVPQAGALKAFQDIDAFFREHISTQPTPIDSGLVEHVSLETN